MFCIAIAPYKIINGYNASKSIGDASVLSLALTIAIGIAASKYNKFVLVISCGVYLFISGLLAFVRECNFMLKATQFAWVHSFWLLSSVYFIVGSLLIIYKSKSISHS
jgi:hypothetical protein